MEEGGCVFLRCSVMLQTSIRLSRAGVRKRLQSSNLAPKASRSIQTPYLNKVGLTRLENESLFFDVRSGFLLQNKFQAVGFVSSPAHYQLPLWQSQSPSL
jgi:hypothetical protein